MHLFTLLIASAFATQFTAPNPTADVFKVVPDTILHKSKTAEFKFKATAKTANTWPVDAAVYYIVSQDPALDGTKAASEAIKDTIAADDHDLNEIEVTVNTANMTTLTGVGLTAFTFYVYVGLTDADGALANEPFPVKLIPDFTPDRKALRKTKLEADGSEHSITLTEEGDASWGTGLTVVVTKETDGTGGIAYDLTGQTAGTAIIKITKANWTSIKASGDPTEIYVFVGAEAEAARKTPGYKIDVVEDKFSVTPATIAKDAVKFKNLVIEAPSPLNPAPIDNKVQFLLSKTEIFDLTDAALVWDDAVLGQSETKKYSKANVAIGALAPLAKNEIIYIYGKYTQTIETKPVTTYISHSQEITVGDNLFTVSPTSISRGLAKIDSVTVETSALQAGAWGTPINVTFTKTSAPPTVPADVIAWKEPAVSQTTKYVMADVTLPTAAEWLANPKIFVHVGVNVSNAYVFDDPPVEITVNPEWSVTSTAILQADTTIKVLTVTPVAELVHADAEKKEITLHFAVDAAADRTKIPAAHTAVVTKGSAAAYTQATWTIPATLKLMKGMPLYVFASYDKSATSNTLTWLEPALTLAVGGTDVLEYAVEPTSVAVGATTLAGFKIVPTKPEYWTTETIAYKITDDTAQSNFEKTGTIKKLADLNEWAPTTPISLSDVTLDVAKPLKVHVSMTAATTYLPVVDTITVSPPPAAFTVEPDTVDVKKSADFNSIKLTEKATTKTWDKVWVVVSKTAGLQAVDPTKDVEKTDQTATAGVVTIALETADITKLGKLDAPTTLYVYAAKGSTGAALAATPATIAFENVISFTIAPKEMVWAENLTTPEITITPNDAALFPQAASTDFIAKFTKGTGTTAVSVEKAVTVTGDKAPFVYKIPATDLATLTIAKPTASETLKVSLHQTAGEIGTAVDFKINKPGGGGEAAMGVSPLLSLLAAALLLLIKLF